MTRLLEILGFVAFGLAAYVAFFAVVGLPFYFLGKRSWKAVQAQRRASGRIRGVMTRMARETLLLVPAKESGFSKLGGEPELPAGAGWPEGRKRPRTFVGQIDLAAFRQHGGPEWLPQQGRLYVFTDEDGWGFADETKVLYSLEPPGPATAAPAGVPSRFKERRVAFLPTRSVPSTDWLDADLSQLSDEDLDAVASLHDEPYGDELQHRIGGYPSEIQGGRMQVECELRRRELADDAEVTPAIERAARQWRLLLQVDSDPALGMNWGDGGRLYVFVREKDARAGDFSRTVALSQSN